MSDRRLVLVLQADLLLYHHFAAGVHVHVLSMGISRHYSIATSSCRANSGHIAGLFHHEVTIYRYRLHTTRVCSHVLQWQVLLLQFVVMLAAYLLHGAALGRDGVEVLQGFVVGNMKALLVLLQTLIKNHLHFILAFDQLLANNVTLLCRIGSLELVGINLGNTLALQNQVVAAHLLKDVVGANGTAAHVH